ncbi:acetamidase/formamidase family protein [Acuticoccus sp. MNP-M23]|uniref:acetamidase/formamidase family protein n=1 Tax=Acuticoccus sp. MNP-M23 TaxID=3072793 RepID=UPI002815D4B2|nr:acetamidase/formamidase family protein [Acuticoccus sp. MNP-M23]WMS44898.1 acetamidase/formamidase family protein [Acuticoccus sp. MNP-M23]
MANHEIPATYDNMVWGYFDAATPPILRVASGDTVRLHSFPAGSQATLHPDRSRVPPAYLEAMEKLERGGPHFVTGPVYVDGAMPGDVLQIDILESVVNMDHGHMSIMPNLGTAPDVFTDYETIHPDVDLARGMMVMPWGTEIPLDPFFGVIAVAPPASWGRHPSPVPRAFGGNMDNKELRPGTTLYLPVFNEGALFTAGDGHGVQGDGEVCVTALETGLTGSFRLTVRKDLAYKKPFAENAEHLISIGLNEDLDDAAREAVLEMVDRICERTSLTPNQAYMLCSVAADLRVTQLVDGNKGIHAMLAKKYL